MQHAMYFIKHINNLMLYVRVHVAPSSNNGCGFGLMHSRNEHATGDHLMITAHDVHRFTEVD
jgi:hypothetical protein